MAKEKTQADVELARIKADLERSRLICGTLKFGLSLLFGTILAGIICWTIVRITDKPAWLTVVLSVLGLLGGTSTVMWRMSISLRRKAEAIDTGEIEAAPADATPALSSPTDDQVDNPGE